MAHFTMEMPPAMSGDSADAVALRKFLARLVDRLMYTLNNIDDENMLNNSVSLSKIRGGEAGIANATLAQIGTANVGSASMQHLNTQVAEIVTAVIRTAVVDWANLKHVVGDTAIISRFVGDSMFIDHLAVNSAQVVQMTVGTLCVKAHDGKYYTLDVDIDTGLVTASETIVTEEEFENGITDSGKHIIESDLTVEELNASNINAVEALISRIIAQRIDVDELFAREATIEKLTTGEIASALGQSLNLSSNESIQSTVRTISGEDREQVMTQLTQVRQTANSASASVQSLQDRLGTHFIIENDKIRITQDQTKEWEMRLTATEMYFLNRTTQLIAARFGAAGGYADRLQSYKKLSVGTDANGWYDMTERGGAVDDKWRGSSSDAAAIITAQPQDVVADVGDSTFTLELTAENATGYQWGTRERGRGDWNGISGADSDSWTGSLSTEALAREYRCLVDGVASEAVRVRVDGAPVILLEKTSGSTITLTVSGTVSSYTWQAWQTSAWAPITTGSANSITVTDPGDYRCVVEDANGRKAVSSVFTID